MYGLGMTIIYLLQHLNGARLLIKLLLLVFDLRLKVTQLLFNLGQRGIVLRLLWVQILKLRLHLLQLQIDSAYLQILILREQRKSHVRHSWVQPMRANYQSSRWYKGCYWPPVAVWDWTPPRSAYPSLCWVSPAGSSLSAPPPATGSARSQTCTYYKHSFNLRIRKFKIYVQTIEMMLCLIYAVKRKSSFTVIID